MKRIAPLACLALALGCGASNPPEEPIDVSRQAVAPDPAAASTFTSCPDEQGLGGLTTLIRYPSADGCATPLPDSPLVVLLPGNDYEYDQYLYLQDHLARNGIVTASISILATDNHPGHLAAAAEVKNVLKDLLTIWTHGGAIDPERLGVVGHSRGGLTAQYVADALKASATWTVRAVVSLAGLRDGNMTLDGSQTPALMLLQGTSDIDTLPAVGFNLHDNSGIEGSTGPWHPNRLYKSMKLLHGGDHSKFSERDASGTTQHLATQGYVLAFLGAHLMTDATWYEDYVRGDAVPGGYVPPVTSQVTDGFLRNVIDNFQDNLVGGSTIVGAVTVSANVNASIRNLDADLDSPHRTYALSMAGKVAGASIEWSIPPAHADTSEYRWLSFRIGQTDGAPATDLMVQIENDGDWSDPVQVTAHGKIPAPVEMCTLPFLCEATAQDHMGTVRIPMDTFGPRTQVSAVRFVFQGNAVRKSFLLDNLELAEWIHKP